MLIALRSTEEFIHEIEEIVYYYDVPYLEAVIMYCENNNIEIEVIAPIISKNENLRAKLMIEGEDLNYLKKTARLPI
jgi:hypothetical protein